MDVLGRDMEKLFSFDHLEKPVKEHLKNVYSSLAIGLLLAAAGTYINLIFNFALGGFLGLIVSIGLMLAIMMTPHSPQNTQKRLLYFWGFALLSGMSLGPLVQAVINIDPSIVPTAFMATGLIFVCFTMASLITNDRKFLYLGGLLMSGLSLLCFMSFINIFFGSRGMFEAELYLGLGIFCLFVLYDTQLIVEKARHGDLDYVWHSVDLFIDFVAIFRRLMVLLANKEQKKKRRD
jgi:FtsH-binding integral membrane protein